MLSILFFVLFLGNIITTSMVIPQKLQERMCNNKVRIYVMLYFSSSFTRVRRGQIPTAIRHMTISSSIGPLHIDLKYFSVTFYDSIKRSRLKVEWKINGNFVKSKRLIVNLLIKSDKIITLRFICQIFQGVIKF